MSGIPSSPDPDGFEQRVAAGMAKTRGAGASAPPAGNAGAVPGVDADEVSRRIREALARVQRDGKPGAGGAATAPAATTPGAATPGAATTAAERGTGPVGTGEHVVKQGECISSIAKETGHFWETIWNDAANTDLRQIRQDPNILLPEDRVHVPPLRPKREPGQAEMRHRFRRKGEPEILRFRVLRDDTPRANQPWRLEVDGVAHQGTTDPQGKLACPIPGNARRAVLRVGTALEVEEYVFALGGIDPISELSGVQGRLNNLGFDCGTPDGVLGPRTQEALRTFQKKHKLPETGRADQATRQKLQSEYGS